MGGKRRRTLILIVSSVAILLPMGIAVGRAATESVPGSRLSCVDWSARTTSASSSSRRWADIPGMRVSDRLALNFMVQMSATLDGSDVQLRVVDDTVGGTSPLLPGPTTFRVGAVSEGASFAWVGSNPSEHRHVFRLQWRVPNGGRTTMLNGSLTLLYQGAPTPAAC
ncbi:MAG TPA: hypothetical protein VIE12_03410 [Actinomycetota bacterium]|jgi:hypothetical protein